MPKRVPAVTDEVLRREAGMLADDVRILPQQMAILTGLSVDALKERRRTRPPKPPLPEPRERAGNAVWYSMASVRHYRAWLREHALAGGVQSEQIPAPSASFGAWLNTAASDECWPMALVGATLHPVDFWATVRGEVTLCRKDLCVWLTALEYAAMLVTALRHESALRSASALAEAAEPPCDIARPGGKRL